MNRIARIRHGGTVRFARVLDDAFELLDGADLFALMPTGERLARNDSLLAAPATPTKIVAVGLNYRAHAAEMSKPLPTEPLLFIKPSSAVVAAGEPIRLPRVSAEVHHEAEVALVIGRLTRGVSAEEARSHVWGITCLNDVTARDIQRREVQYTRAKSFDTFAPIGPWVLVGEIVGDRAVVGRVNGQIRQQGRTSDMVFDPYTLVSYISQCMTLFPGDVITTGTPPGVGSLRAGDRVEVDIEGVGVLSNPVIAEEDA
jgi:2-keto-4-pentenoate hydratase/2-oxohepta-3-ene-1,7-dioic acid hydratase in catechol pathway